MQKSVLLLNRKRSLVVVVCVKKSIACHCTLNYYFIQWQARLYPHTHTVEHRENWINYLFQSPNVNVRDDSGCSTAVSPLNIISFHYSSFSMAAAANIVLKYYAAQHTNDDQLKCLQQQPWHHPYIYANSKHQEI